MSQSFQTINPFNQKVIKKYEYISSEEIVHSISVAEETFKVWKKEKIADRTKLLDQLAANLSKSKEKLSQLMTQEMGKPIRESRAEIEKCIWLCDFYAKNAESLLADKIIKTEAQESFISYDPLGLILGVMPWNYPFWQVFRFAVPAITVGNVVFVKHASNVSACALAIQSIFEQSGYPKGCYTAILANHESVGKIIKHRAVKAVSLTGSEKAGRKIAEIAGSQLKKLVLELGGNNACVILNDADLDVHLDTIVKARMQNTGQSCIAAKRFIVEEGIYDQFLEKFTAKVKALKSGDPTDEDTDIAVLAREDLADILEKQVHESVQKGAKVHYGNKRDKAYYQATILTNVSEDMPVFTDETFGPVAAVMKVANKEEAYRMVSKTNFGLGTMVFTEDVEDAKRRIIDIEDGAFFINEMVKSDPRLPFGGTKNSGYGRELSQEGLLAFTNKKTVYVK